MTEARAKAAVDGLLESIAALSRSLDSVPALLPAPSDDPAPNHEQPAGSCCCERRLSESSSYAPEYVRHPAGGPATATEARR